MNLNHQPTHIREAIQRFERYNEELNNKRIKEEKINQIVQQITESFGGFCYDLHDEVNLEDLIPRLAEEALKNWTDEDLTELHTDITA